MKLNSDTALGFRILIAVLSILPISIVVCYQLFIRDPWALLPVMVAVFVLCPIAVVANAFIALRSKSTWIVALHMLLLALCATLFLVQATVLVEGYYRANSTHRASVHTFPGQASSYQAQSNSDPTSK